MPSPRRRSRPTRTSDFYDASGKFLVDKAKAAYFDMMDTLPLPDPRQLRKEMWVLDFGLNDFVHVGMAGIFWLNRKDYGYFGHEIFLLPGQMIAEHAHVETKQGPAKMESWHVRHGMIYTLRRRRRDEAAAGQAAGEPGEVPHGEALRAARGRRGAAT